MLNFILSKFPMSSTLFLGYALAGAGMLIAGTLDYAGYSTTLLAVGVACGAIGAPRAVTKLAQGIQSVNFLGFIESIPVPTLVFIVFTAASTVDLVATHNITFAAFSTNLTKVGIGCGAVQSARAIEGVLTPFIPKIEHKPSTPTVTPPVGPAPPPPA